MSYTLGNITLPTPKPENFSRAQVEKSKTIVTLDGSTKKDYTNRKEQFIIAYEKLTQAEVTSILSEYNLQITRDFAVSETNLTITATAVHIELFNREYNTGGDEYREDLTLILTEVV